mmetsp:Transcript_30545/g.42038  ORF Transcript_30545/g.42038 Transcript_30545/m.42038 type:complete len:1359 (-) Transcript_30545:23-4099(-)
MQSSRGDPLRVVVGTCNMNQWAMDFDGNLNRIIQSISNAKTQLEGRCKFRTGPELEVCGYSCGDHFLELDTYLHCEQSLAAILQHPDLTNDILCDIGCPIMHNNNRYNCRVYILNRQIVLISPKVYPSDDKISYHEKRFFASWDLKTNGAKKGVHQKLGNYKIDPGANGPVYMEEHILSDLLRNVTNQIAVPFGVAVLATEETTIAVDMLGDLQGPYLSKVEIITNGFQTSHHELRKLSSKLSLLKVFTHRFGGAYVYSNHVGGDGNGKLYFDGSSSVFSNGELVAQCSQFTLADVEVLTAVVDLTAIRSYRGGAASLLDLDAKVLAACKLPVIDIRNFSLQNKLLPVADEDLPMAIRIHTPEEECVLGPACWLWDYLRRSNAGGFLLPLSGTADSASVAAIVRVMCILAARAAVLTGNVQVIQDISRLFNDTNKCEIISKLMQRYGFSSSNTVSSEYANQLTSDGPNRFHRGNSFGYEDDDENSVFESKHGDDEEAIVNNLADEITQQVLHTAYMGSADYSYKKNSATLKIRAQTLADSINSYHTNIDIDSMISLVIKIFSMLTNKTIRPLANGGSRAEDIALRNIQTRLRMIMAYFCAQLMPWCRGNSGELILLEGANVDKSLIGGGSYSAHSWASADINPIGGMTQADIKRMLMFVSKTFKQPILEEIVDAESDNALSEMHIAAMQSSVASTNGGAVGSMTYSELGMFGYLRKVLRCGPVQTFLKLVDFWKPVSPTLIAAKVKQYYYLYATCRRKSTAQTLSYHLENFSLDYKSVDLRQLLYNSQWVRQFRTIDSIVQSNPKMLDKISNDPIKKNVLLIIDPQIDFHPEGGEPGTRWYHPPGALAVPGANEDSDRIAAMIKKHKHEIHEIYVSMDSHQPAHIAHAMFWASGADGVTQPTPFTVITHDEVAKGIWRPRDTRIETLNWCMYYTELLERKGQMKLVIWPQHCIIGSRGHAVVPVINDALQEWIDQFKVPKCVNYVHKGQNCRSEMYSAFMAEVPDPRDPSTELDRNLMARINEADTLIICGQGMSHCVNHTLRDLMKNWRSEMSKLVLLTDGSSPVPGFEFAVDLLMTDARTMGVTVTTTEEVFEIRNSSLHGGRHSIDASAYSVSFGDDNSTNSGPNEGSHSAPATSRVAADSPTNLAVSLAARKVQQQVSPAKPPHVEPLPSSLPAPGDGSGKKVSPRSAKVVAKIPAPVHAVANTTATNTKPPTFIAPSHDKNIMTKKISECIDEENDEEPDEGHSALQGKYSIGEELGYGGYATVRLGTNLKTREQVAVKIITRKGLSREDENDVRNEATIMKTLKHPNIIKLVEMIEGPRYFYLVVELMPGGELFDRIIKRSHYTEKYACNAT